MGDRRIDMDKPIRKETTDVNAQSSWMPETKQVSEDDVEHSVRSGAVHSHTNKTLTAADCGHITSSPAGFCSLCNSMMCSRCHVQCHECLKPLGTCCAIIDAEKRSIYRCPECDARYKRSRFWRGIAEIFVSFDDDKK